jgi:hypothetical protein
MKEQARTPVSLRTASQAHRVLSLMAGLVRRPRATADTQLLHMRDLSLADSRTTLSNMHSIRAVPTAHLVLLGPMHDPMVPAPLARNLLAHRRRTLREDLHPHFTRNKCSLVLSLLLSRAHKGTHTLNKHRMRSSSSPIRRPTLNSKFNLNPSLMCRCNLRCRHNPQPRPRRGRHTCTILRAPTRTKTRRLGHATTRREVQMRRARHTLSPCPASRSLRRFLKPRRRLRS